MNWPNITFSQRRTVLKLAAIGIIAYSIIVLIWANLIPYLGIQVFKTEVFGVDVPPVLGRTPEIGDRIRTIAHSPVIDSWPRYVNVVANLRERYSRPNDIVADLSQVAPDAKDAHTASGEHFVRIEFQPADASKSTYASWFAVRELPWQKTAVSVIWAGLQSAIFWMGWLVYRRRPEDDAAALFFLSCVLTVGAYLGGHHWLQLVSQPALIFVFAVCAMALPQVNLHFYLLFPTPKRWVVRHPRVVMTLLYVAPGCLQIAILWTIGSVISTFRHDPSADRLEWLLIVLRNLVWCYVGLSAALFSGCVAAVLSSYRSARQPVQRNQLRWILAGAAVSSLFVAYSLFLSWRDPINAALGGATWAMFGASLAFTGAHAVSIARYRLMDVETIVQRGRVYLLVSFLGSLAYYGLLLLLAFVSPQLIGAASRPEGLLVSASVILVLLIANTVRSNIQKVLDRRFFREKHQLERTMRRLDEAVGMLPDGDVVWRRTLAVAVDLSNARSGAVYRRVDEGFRRVEKIGDAKFPESVRADHALVRELERGSLLQINPGPILPGETASIELRKVDAQIGQPFLDDGRLEGFLLLGRRNEGIYIAEELSFLAGLADVAGVAIHSARTQQTLERLNDELRDKIARVAVQQRQIETVKRIATSEREADGEFDEIRGSSPAVRELIASVRKVADSQATVLLRGESGTGKSLLASVLHRHSPRSAGPFVPVHCAALSPGVLESELFGHVKGAFTGAHRDKVGRFQAADGGTLFLDEIGDISLDIQTKLLRVLQDRTFEPVGASTPKTVDVRLIAATNQPLEELIRQGRFREDLFYRLNVIGLRTPPLRDRQDDVYELAMSFLRRFAERQDKRLQGIDDDAVSALLSHSWPGNVRELENVMERAVVMAEGESISVEDLPAEIFSGQSPVAPLAVFAGAAARRTIAVHEPAGGLMGEIESLEKQRLSDALVAARGNKAEAARRLGYRRSTFCSKLKRHGLA